MTFNLFTTVSKGLSLFKQTNHNMMSFMSEAQFVTEELNMFLKLKYQTNQEVGQIRYGANLLCHTFKLGTCQRSTFNKLQSSVCEKLDNTTPSSSNTSKQGMFKNL